MKAQVNEEACTWISRLHGGEPTEEELARLKAWMQAKPENAIELRRMAKLWGELNILTDLAVSRPERTPRFFRWNFQRYAVIASFLLVSAFVALKMWQPAEPHLYTTAIGEQKNIILSDGSEVVLNTDTRLSVEYSDEMRAVYLVKGEALFDVAKDAERPFQVYAGNALIRAIGTRFAVRLNQADVEVTVTESAVSVVQASADALPKLGSEPLTPIVSAGQSAAFDQAAGSVVSIADVEPRDLEKKLAWQYGTLRFSGERLEEVVDEFSRYTSLSIVILDAELRDRRIGAIFNAGDSQRFLNTLQESYGVNVAYIDNNLVHLSSSGAKGGVP